MQSTTCVISFSVIYQSGSIESDAINREPQKKDGFKVERDAFFLTGNCMDK
jgi:hypothetical protein